ncbi:MAG: hypothetical protein EXR93_07040 [Gemmatimonadetes bacterium]|nr:hypothetical protein [Gemmatimonadota bacterium]
MLAVRLFLQVATTLSAQGVLAGTHVNPIPGSGTLTELRVLQPVLMLHSTAVADHLSLHATLNLEGLTIPNGVLTVGAWGEGFNDRRHPHTYAHEVIITGNDLLGPRDGAINISISAGKGFVPFGSDDPMSRPALAYPVNHHWSQVLERAVALLGVRTGPVLLEAALFNGDEPERPAQWPRVAGRFGDSWSARVTAFPAPWLEIAGSHASVNSPEHRPGAGSVQQKWHLSARAERGVGIGQGYALLEWARTTEFGGFFAFNSLLGEASLALRGSRGYYRFERTDRPEESRTINLFRSLRPHLENTILGTTRWSVHTAGSRVRLGIPVPARLEAVVEGSYARAEGLSGGLFQPISIYGRDTVWSLTLGISISTGDKHRMGRYGAAAEHTH